MTRTCIVGALLLQAAAAAMAQSASASASASATGTASASAAAFRCGGVGEEDQRHMKAEAAQHALMLTFASTSGAYLADVDVQITRGGRTVLQGHCNGPLMLVDLAPAGSYEVRATADGKTQQRTVTVGGKPASATLTWPTP